MNENLAPKPARHGVIAIIRDQDRYLAIRRSQWVTAPGRICFPGGGVEPGETEEEAICRELHEELDLRSVVPGRCVWKSATKWDLDLSWWTVHICEPHTVRANPTEVADVFWRTMQQLMDDADLLDTNLDFLRLLATGQLRLE